jgi:hypothetical protein
VKEKAEELRGRYVVAIADMRDPSEQDLASQFGITKLNLPATFLVDVRKKISYKFEGKTAYMNQFMLQEFVDLYEKG